MSSLLRAIFCILIGGHIVIAQNPPRDDVVRVYTNLVQAEVTVLDRGGQVVRGLKREDFELRVAEKPKPIEAFDFVITGSALEEGQLKAPHGESKTKNPSSLVRGRTIFFYVDDLHLRLGSVSGTKRLVADFVAKSMGQYDEIGITSASGQIGFLEQLTNNKIVLNAALGRLVSRPRTNEDRQEPRMTEYDAILINNHRPDVISYFISETVRLYGVLPDMALQIINQRSQVLLQQAAHATNYTLRGLEKLIESGSALPGRKLVFLISDGVFLDAKDPDPLQRIRKIVKLASQTGVVIYSVDAKGLIGDENFDLSGRLRQSNHDEITASQDGMNALASDSGGKTIFNTNDSLSGLKRVLDETSAYYLLTWKVDLGETTSKEFRKVEVRIKGRPELEIRVRTAYRNLSTGKPETTSNAQDPKVAEPENKLSLAEALREPYPKSEFPLSLSLNYVAIADRRPMLSTFVHIPLQSVSFTAETGVNNSPVEVLGSIYDDKGRSGSQFGERLNVTLGGLPTNKTERREISYNFPVVLKPGLYQVRVAAREENSGRIGNVRDWIEIPDLSQARLALSTLIIGELTEEKTSAVDGVATQQTLTNVTNRFQQDSTLHFLVYIYSAMTPGNIRPDLTVQVQVQKDNQLVLSMPSYKVSLDGFRDLSQLSYAAKMSLKGYSVGRYKMVVTVTDALTKTSARQERNFEIE